jgi:hypothetical protein
MVMIMLLLLPMVMMMLLLLPMVMMMMLLLLPMVMMMLLLLPMVMMMLLLLPMAMMMLLLLPTVTVWLPTVVYPLTLSARRMPSATLASARTAAVWRLAHPYLSIVWMASTTAMRLMLTAVVAATLAVQEADVLTMAIARVHCAARVLMGKAGLAPKSHHLPTVAMAKRTTTKQMLTVVAAASDVLPKQPALPMMTA